MLINHGFSGTGQLNRLNCIQRAKIPVALRTDRLNNINVATVLILACCTFSHKCITTVVFIYFSVSYILVLIVFLVFPARLYSGKKNLLLQ